MYHMCTSATGALISKPKSTRVSVARHVMMVGLSDEHLYVCLLYDDHHG
jgi:hypothetical protein